MGIKFLGWYFPRLQKKGRRIFSLIILLLFYRSNLITVKFQKVLFSFFLKYASMLSSIHFSSIPVISWRLNILSNCILVLFTGLQIWISRNIMSCGKSWIISIPWFNKYLSYVSILVYKINAFEGASNRKASPIF